jgi:ATP-binding cassette subfamily F protein 2
MSRWQEKRAREAEFQLEKELSSGGNGIDLESMMAKDTRGAAMGDGDEELFEKKLSKEEKKALAKAKREAKKKGKGKTSKKENDDAPDEEEKKEEIPQVTLTSKEQKRQALLDDLVKNDIVVTYESKRGALHANTRDINVSGVTVAFHGKHLIEETDIVINYGNRYGLIGPNGSGKVC